MGNGFNLELTSVKGRLKFDLYWATRDFSTVNHQFFLSIGVRRRKPCCRPLLRRIVIERRFYIGLPITGGDQITTEGNEYLLGTQQSVSALRRFGAQSNSPPVSRSLPISPDSHFITRSTYMSIVTWVMTIFWYWKWRTRFKRLCSPISSDTRRYFLVMKLCASCN